MPSPILQPGSPPQESPKPSLSEIYKTTTPECCVESFGFVESRGEEYTKSPSFRAAGSEFPDCVTTRGEQTLEYQHRNNSDVSFLDLGSPFSIDSISL